MQQGGFHMAVIDIKKVTNVTIYTGDKGAESCTCKCPCCSQTSRERTYQGTLEQVAEMLELLPSLQHAYLCGNPDPSVDSLYCNYLMKKCVEKGIKVSFSTSGVGGKKTMQTLLDGIPTEMVDYASISYDATTKEEMSFFKGVNYPMESSLEGLQWLVDQGYTVKVQPTLWNSNYQKAGELIEFFRARGVRWFTFHVGSLESGVNLTTHQHLTSKQLKEVHELIDKAVRTKPDVKVRCPDFYDHGQWDGKFYCMHPETCVELLLFFSPEGIRATHAPIAAAYTSKMSWILGKEPAEVPDLKGSEYCPFSTRLTGGNSTHCRFLSRYWGYENL